MTNVETSYRHGDPSVEHTTERPPRRPDARHRWGGRLLALGAFLLLGGGLAGAARYYTQHGQAMAQARVEPGLAFVQGRWTLVVDRRGVGDYIVVDGKDCRQVGIRGIANKHESSQVART